MEGLNLRLNFTTTKGIPVVMETMYGMPCEFQTFWVNGKNAYIGDFGISFDDVENNDRPYACQNRTFRCWDLNVPEELTKQKQTLIDLNISSQDWVEIAQKLKEILSIGFCDWCE